MSYKNGQKPVRKHNDSAKADRLAKGARKDRLNRVREREAQEI